MALASPSREKRSTSSGAVLALLAIVVFLNFFDRSNLSIAAPLLKDELSGVACVAVRVVRS